MLFDRPCWSLLPQPPPGAMDANFGLLAAQCRMHRLLLKFCATKMAPQATISIKVSATDLVRFGESEAAKMGQLGLHA